MLKFYEIWREKGFFTTLVKIIIGPGNIIDSKSKFWLDDGLAGFVDFACSLI